MGLEVDHTWADAVDLTGSVSDQGAMDAQIAAMDRFVVYRIRFRIANSSDAPIETVPLLEAGTGAEPDAWSPVPAVDPTPGSPFYVASDDDRVFRARSDSIRSADLRLPEGPSADFVPVDGEASAGLNPAPTLSLPAHAYTEVEFAVRASVGAAWRATYAFRLQPTANTVEAGAPLIVTMREKPPIRLTLPASTTTRATALDGPTTLGGPQYALAVATGSTGQRYQLAATVDPSSPHISASLADDGCAACHSAHRASSAPLITDVYRVDPLRSALEPYDGADFALCIQCHQESPFADTSGSANPLTSFPGHGYHLGLIEENGTGGLEITTPGDGQGNALCAECHYNLHGVPGEQRGLVIFAPDVEPYNGEIVYDAANGSCTLTCHGRPHDGLTFATPTSGT